MYLHPSVALLLTLSNSSLTMTDSVSLIFEPLVDMLAERFDADNHLVVHPSGHWVVKRLLNSEGGRNEEVEGEREAGEDVSKEESEGGSEEGKGERGDSFAERILDRVSGDDIQAWTTTNRGAFVTCR